MARKYGGIGAPHVKGDIKMVELLIVFAPIIILCLAIATIGIIKAFKGAK